MIPTDIPEIEYDDTDFCPCETCDLERQVRELKSTLLFALAVPVYRDPPKCGNYCCICGSLYNSQICENCEL